MKDESSAATAATAVSAQLRFGEWKFKVAIWPNLDAFGGGNDVRRCQSNMAHVGLLLGIPRYGDNLLVHVA